MARKKKTLDELGQEAIKLHQKLLYDKVLELVLGEMCEMDGISETRMKLKWWYDHLREFDKKTKG
jgi:hypothetical protein